MEGLFYSRLWWHSVAMGIAGAGPRGASSLAAEQRSHAWGAGGQTENAKVNRLLALKSDPSHFVTRYGQNVTFTSRYIFNLLCIPFVVQKQTKEMICRRYGKIKLHQANTYVPRYVVK